MKNRKILFEFKTKEDVGTDEIYIEGWANRAMMGSTKVIDRGRENIPAGEWKIDEWKKNPIIFFNHNRDIPIGQGVAAKVTDEGLWIKAKISKSNAPDIMKARDLIQEGILKTFSVGIDVEEEEVADDNTITLKGVNLLETSVVSIPMNQESFFSISKKMLEDKPLDVLAYDILKAKGAQVAAAIHQQIYVQQAQSPDFNRADVLTEIASSAGVSQGELMMMLAGNTAMFPDNVLEAVSSVLAMDLGELQELNKTDLAVANADASLNPDEEVQEEEEELAEEKPTDETPAEESTDVAPEGSPEDVKPEPMPGDQEPDEELQAEQPAAVDKPIEESKLPKVGEVEDKPDMQEAVEDETPVSDASKEAEPKDAFQSCVSEKVQKLIGEGKPQDQAVAIAISMCSQGKTCTQLDAKGWQKLFEDIEKFKKEKKAGKKTVPDSSNGTTGEVSTSTPEDSNLGQPAIIALQQLTVLMGQLIAEVQKNNKLLNDMVNVKITDSATTEEKPDEEMELECDPTDEELSVEDSKGLDIVRGYQEKLDKKLSRFGV